MAEARIRYRIQPRWFRKPLVVARVSERVPVNYDPADPFGFGPTQYTDRWRDATPEDFMNLEGKDNGN
jgi:hypothetical protein